MLLFHSVPLILFTLLQTTLAGPLPAEDVFIRSLNKRDTISGPKLNGANFPDPAIIFVDKWYAFATRTIGSKIHIQVATSTDFNTWTLQRNADGSQYNALPNIPAWAVRGNPNTWAPDVNQLDDGSFVMYYSASTVQDTSKHCVGAAVSKSPLGPYTPTSDQPLVCPLAQGGAIDASGFNDNGQRYIMYKVDGNSLGAGGPCNSGVPPLKPTPLMLQAVAPNGYTLQGTPTALLDHNGASDDGILEAPVLVKKNGLYFLLFSSGCFTTTNYDVDYATATSVRGPYARAATPLLSTGRNGLSGPGGADFSKDLKFMVFHANTNGGRAMYTAIVTVNGKQLSI